MALSDATSNYSGSGHGYISSADAKAAITQYYNDVAYHRITPWAVNEYYVTTAHLSAFTIRQTSGDGILFPIQIPVTATISEVNMYVNVASSAGQTIRIAFYNMSSDGTKPGTLIADCGTIDPSSTGMKTISGLSVTLPQGIVWGALIAVSTVATAGQGFSGGHGFLASGTVSHAAIGGARVYTGLSTGSAPADLTSTAMASALGGAPSLLLKRSA